MLLLLFVPKFDVVIVVSDEGNIVRLRFRFRFDVIGVDVFGDNVDRIQF